MKKSSEIDNKYRLNRRAILEIIGLVILLVFTYSQWNTMEIALSEIRQSDFILIAIACGLYWIMLPLTALSFRVLSDKRLNIWTTTLAQLAGSGPGRIIPGGLGRLSLSVIHLVKLGFKSSQAIIITITSNIVGVLVNVFVLCILIFFEPSITSLLDANLIIPSVGFIVFIALAGIGIFQWLIHTKKTKKSTRKLTRKWHAQLSLLRQKPTIILQLIGIAFLILVGYVCILLFSSYSLGIQIDGSDALIALSVGVFIGGVLPTPGGIGGVEAGIASTLVFMGYSPAESTSIALLFRAITYWQPLIPGTFAYFYLRRRKLL